MTEDPYRRIAAYYDRLFERMNRGLRLLGLRMLLPKEGMSVLDVGCGTGAHLDIYRRYKCELHGIDTSLSMLGMADLKLAGEADLRLGDATDMPYEDAAFDLVISMLILHEMDDPTRMGTLNEMKRVLKQNGHILLIDFHPGPIQPFRGWLTKTVILLSELAAGRRHFRNYQHFMATKGLPTLINRSSLKVVNEKVVSGGALALFLLNKN